MAEQADWRRGMKLMICIAFALALVVSTALAAQVLEVGSSGSDVKKVQQRLIRYGYLSGEADGRYGE